MSKLKFINILCSNGDNLKLTYQVFGREIGSAPIVVVNHALTGNSSVAGENGWWKTLVGKGGVIDTEKYTVVCFDIPGNAYDGATFIDNYKDYTTAIVAEVFWQGLDVLKIEQLYAVIGGSLGGGIAWEMAFLRPTKINNLISVVADYKASDWLIADTYVQECILDNCKSPLKVVRMHAMLTYRTPESFTEKFNRQYDSESQEYSVESWLNYHGDTLEKRFQLKAYRMLTYLTKTIGKGINDEVFADFVSATTSNIHVISVDSDCLFPLADQKRTCEKIKEKHDNVFHHIIESKHGHDAFLIEYNQLNQILKNIF